MLLKSPENTFSVIGPFPFLPVKISPMLPSSDFTLIQEANDKLKRKTGIVFCMINILIIRRLDLFFVTKLLLAEY